MLKQIVLSDKNFLAIDIVDGFTEPDEKLCKKLFKEKIDQGFEQVNLLVKLDEMKISKSGTKAFFEDIIWEIRNYKKLGHLAVVAHSNVVKALLPIDNVFFARASKGRQERYFDVSQMEEAITFVNPKD
jgi:hypothetical protein